MKKLLVLALLITFLSVTMAMAADTEEKKYGDDLTLKEQTKISEILANPDNYVGKKVLVSGVVTDVCAKRGCWINLASDKEFDKIRVKVTDGEIVFPMDVKGHEALVEGEVYKMEFDADGNLISKTEDPHVCANHAKEVKEKSEAKSDESCMKEEESKVAEVIYQIRGIGAVVK